MKETKYNPLYAENIPNKTQPSFTVKTLSKKKKEKVEGHVTYVINKH